MLFLFNHYGVGNHRNTAIKSDAVRDLNVSNNFEILSPFQKSSEKKTSSNH